MSDISDVARRGEDGAVLLGAMVVPDPILRSTFFCKHDNNVMCAQCAIFRFLTADCADDTDGDLKIPILQFAQIPKFQRSQNFLKRLNPRICLRQGYSEGIRDQAA
jgi:hypothetical protein